MASLTRKTAPKKVQVSKEGSLTPKKTAAKKSVTLSSKGKVVGRPRINRGTMVSIQTRVPAPLADYLKLLSIEKLPDQPAPFRTMQKMFETVFERFVEEKPWEMGFAFRESHAVARFSGGEIVERSPWKQLNISLPEALAKKVDRTATKVDRSNSSFCYTGLVWWAGVLYPPVSA